MAIAKLENLTYLYDSRTPAGVSQINLEIQAGELISLIGQSGSGKSTLLKVLGRELQVDQPVTLPNYQSIVFSSGMKVPQGPQKVIDYLVSANHTDSDTEEKINQAREYLMSFEITHVIEQNIHSLSFGEKQRVWLSSLLVNDLKLLLLDEAFHGIDWINRENILKELKIIAEEKKFSVIWATQLIKDALSLSDKVVLLHYGRIQQQGTGEDLYLNPQNAFTADFTGVCNKIVIRLKSENDKFYIFESLWGDLQVPKSSQIQIHPQKLEQLLILRPHQLKISDTGYQGKVIEQTFSDGQYLTKVQAQDRFVYLSSPQKIQTSNISFQFDLNHAAILKES